MSREKITEALVKTAKLLEPNDLTEVILYAEYLNRKSRRTKRAADGAACDDIYHDFITQFEEVNFCDVCGKPLRR